MIYGLNFGMPDIPAEIRSRVGERIRRPLGDKLSIFVLVGACQTADEYKRMCIQADNGHRKLYWITRTVRGHGTYHFCYAH